MMTIILLLLAQESPWIETRFHRIRLRNGNFIDGQLLRETPEEVVIEVKSSAELGVRRDLIARVEFVKMRSFKDLPTVAAVIEVPAEAPAAAAPEPVAVTQPRFSAETRRQVDVLLATYGASNPDIRRPLLRGLRELGAEAVAYACSLSGQSRMGIEAAELVEAIAQCEGPDVLPALLRTARGEDVFAKVAALRALARRGTPEAVAALLRALEDPAAPVWRVAVEAVETLLRQGSMEAETLIERMTSKAEKGGYARVLARSGGGPELEALAGLLREGTSRDRIAVLQGLAERRLAHEAERASELLGDEDAEVRKNAIIYLGRIQHGASTEALIERLDDEDEGAADTALWALRQISGQGYGPDRGLWTLWLEKSRP